MSKLSIEESTARERIKVSSSSWKGKFIFHFLWSVFSERPDKSFLLFVYNLCTRPWRGFVHVHVSHDASDFWIIIRDLYKFLYLSIEWICLSAIVILFNVFNFRKLIPNLQFYRAINTAIMSLHIKNIGIYM